MASAATWLATRLPESIFRSLPVASGVSVEPEPMPPPFASSQTLFATTFAGASAVLSPAPAARPSVIDPPSVTSIASPFVRMRFRFIAPAVSTRNTPYVAPTAVSGSGSGLSAKAPRDDCVSVTLRTPNALDATLISSALRGVPTPPRPPMPPGSVLLPACMVMLRPLTSAAVSFTPARAVSATASTIAFGE